MRPNETVFPYPVLGDLNAIPGEKPDAEAIENIPLKEQLALPYRWTFLPSVKNPDILKLIDEGKAQYMCEVTCTATLLRKCFFSKEPKIEVVIGRKEVNKRVDFAIYVVATQHIADYDNSAASEEYRELAPFDLDVDFYGPVSLLGAAPSRPTPQAGEGWSFAGRIQSREVTYRRAPLLSLHASIRDAHRCAPEVDAPAWRQTLWALRRETARRLTLGLGAHPDAAAVLRALLLGYRAEIPTEVRDFFANSGTVHLFAISGLHIMLVAGTLRGLLRRVGASSFAAGLVLIPTIIAYTELTGGRPSAQRACLMAVLYYGAPIFRRKSDALNAVAVAAIALLAANPLQVTDLGFAFSFTSVLGILLLARPLEGALWRMIRGLRGLRRGSFGGKVEKEADELEARMIRAQRSFEKGGWLRRQWWAFSDWCRSRGRKFVGNLAVSIAAWAVAEPITASVFGQMVPISVVSNVLVIFLGSWTVQCAAAGLVVGVFFPWLGVLINRVAAYLVEAMIYITSLFAQVPGGNFHVEPWSPALVAAWYAALCAAALAVARRNRTSV